MSGLYLFVTVIYILLCLVMLVLILSQEGKQQGLGAITGASQETYWSKIK
ncbi:MAG: preprotein translocase subunit SecG, partial [Lachnospiraceae bacterium]|nr:preprotein translocase subunit SecG [Lachnospiraceae bacterium]